MNIISIREDFKNSHKTIDEYVTWFIDSISKGKITPLAFQRTARHTKVVYWKNQKRRNGAVRRYLATRKHTKKELKLFDAIYEKTDRHFGYYKSRNRK